MPSKPHAIPGASPPPTENVLRGGILEIEGRDAEVFLQAQLMNDVRALADLQWQWNGWLTARGRVIALGALLRFDPQRYWLLLPDHPAAAFAAELARFRFRSKVQLLVREELRVRGFRGAPTVFGQTAAFNRAAKSDDRSVWLDLSGESVRTLMIAESGESVPTATHGDPAVMSSLAWEIEDLAHGLPRLPAAAGDAYTPQMLGLERINAYSVRKGCYPGQEIVARTHFLGQAKRQLRRLACESASLAGDTLELDGRAVCEILCAASDTIRHESLAVIPLSDADATLRNRRTGHTMRVIDFATGLTR